MFKFLLYNKYLYILIFAVLLSSFLFIWVRIPRKNLNIKVLNKDDTETTPARFDVNNIECENKTPYTIIKKTFDTFLLCLTKAENPILLKCPANTVFNKNKVTCGELGDSKLCVGKPKNTKIPMSRREILYNIPYNRGYYLCENNAIEGTYKCPVDKPLFDGHECVPNNNCYKKPDGWKYSHEILKTSYFECINSKPVQKDCPSDHYFLHDKCVLKNMCFEKPSGEKFSISNKPEWYVECINGNPLKRKCPELQDFHNIKKRCVDKTPCLYRANQNIAFGNMYLKRTLTGAKCDEFEKQTTVICSDTGMVFDENLGECRKFDNFQDLRVGRIYPISTHSFYNNVSDKIQTVGPTEIVDTQAGLIRSICWGKPDKMKITHQADITKYIECFKDGSNVKSCGADEIFYVDECSFMPCLIKPANSSGIVPQKPNTRFYCKPSSIHTFLYDCPPGTRPQNTRCVVDNAFETKNIKNIFPKYISENEYLDVQDISHKCTNERILNLGNPITPFKITEQVSPFLFKCVDKQCRKINYSSWPLVPVNTKKGVECFDGKVQQMIECKNDEFINFEKVLSGKYELPNCVPNASQSFVDNKSVINSRNFFVLLFNQNLNHAIDKDGFQEKNGIIVYRNINLERDAEDIKQPLNPIVSQDDIENYSAVPKDVVCPNNQQNAKYPGYPKFYKKCANNTTITCGNGEIFLKGQRKNVNIYPVYSNCKLFALGTSATDYRLFKCPKKAPFFNYSQNKCVKNIVASQFLCEEFYFKNYELFSSSESHALPENDKIIE